MIPNATIIARGNKKPWSAPYVDLLHATLLPAEVQAGPWIRAYAVPSSAGQPERSEGRRIEAKLRSGL